MRTRVPSDQSSLLIGPSIIEPRKVSNRNLLHLITPVLIVELGEHRNIHVECSVNVGLIPIAGRGVRAGWSAAQLAGHIGLDTDGLGFGLDLFLKEELALHQVFRQRVVVVGGAKEIAIWEDGVLGVFILLYIKSDISSRNSFMLSLFLSWSSRFNLLPPTTLRQGSSHPNKQDNKGSSSAGP